MAFNGVSPGRVLVDEPTPADTDAIAAEIRLVFQRCSTCPESAMSPEELRMLVTLTGNIICLCDGIEKNGLQGTDCPCQGEEIRCFVEFVQPHCGRRSL